MDDPFSIGAGNEIRTRDLNLGKVALYQLSYSRVTINTCSSKLVPGTGIEPVRPLTGKRRILSPQCLPISPPGLLTSTRQDKTGAGNETRTRDLNLGKVALYQLSYSRLGGAWL